MAAAGGFPFRGSVIWLTPEQGGRETGPPVPVLSWPYYAATAFVPPHTAGTGLASFVLRLRRRGVALPGRGTLAGRRYPT
jgi:hypothetical protein